MPDDADEAMRTLSTTADPVYLTTKPQVLGIVPTLRFWNTHAPWLSRVGLVGCCVAPPLLIVLASVNPVLAAVAPLASYYLGLGLLERWVRKKVAARRAG
jgi:hypothetical protein